MIRPLVGMPLEQLRSLVAADPKFAPAVVDLIYRLPASSGKRRLSSRRWTPCGLPPTPQLPLRSWPCHGKRRPARGSSSIALPALAAYIRANPSLRAAWLLFASTLSSAVVHDYPAGTTAQTYEEDDTANGCC